MDAAVFNAATAQAEQDALWRESPALEDSCEHDLDLLPIVQFRIAIVCRNCGGLARELSEQVRRAAMRDPARFRAGPDGILRDGTVRIARWPSGPAPHEYAENLVRHYSCVLRPCPPVCREAEGHAHLTNSGGVDFLAWADGTVAGPWPANETARVIARRETA